jgi:soluble lytic murein transglycosylase-like protein
VILRICLTLFIVFGLGLSTVQANQKLGAYLYKNKDLKPTSKHLKRLLQHDHLVRYFSRFPYFKNGGTVNADFLRSLMIAESSVNPKAVSSAAAYGLTQITLPTGREAAREILKYNYDFKYVDERKLANLKAEDLHDPAINILICSYLIGKYNARYGRQLDLVVSAWNAGEGAISKYNGVPHYKETMTLVSRVCAYYIFFSGDRLARKAG